MRALAWMAVGLGVIASTGSAQVVRPRVVSDDSSVPFVAKVTGINVNVRSGPGVAFRACTRLSRPAKVRVVALEQNGKWAKILPPQGAFSVISKEYVKLSADGKTGTVTGNNVWTRAGGELLSFDSTRQLDIQIRKQQGDQVKVLGEAGIFYKIEPPKGAFYYMTTDYLERTDEAFTGTITATAPADGETDEGDQTTDTPTTKPSDTVTVVVDKESKPEPDPRLQAFEAAKAELAQELEKPYERRDLRKVLATFQAIDVEKNDFLKPFVDAYLRYIQTELKRAAARKAAEELVRQTNAKIQDLEIQRTKLETGMPETGAVATYAAQGVLVPSAIFNGEGTQPKRYVLRDAHTRKVLAYVEAGDGGPDLDAYTKKLVGLIGPTSYDKSLGRNIVEAHQVVVLDDKVRIDDPIEPTVLPSPGDPIRMPKVDPAPSTQPAETTEPTTAPSKTSDEPTTRPSADPSSESGTASVDPVDLEEGTAGEDKASSDSAPLPATGLPLVPATTTQPAAVDEAQFG